MTRWFVCVGLSVSPVVIGTLVPSPYDPLVCVCVCVCARAGLSVSSAVNTQSPVHMTRWFVCVALSVSPAGALCSYNRRQWLVSCVTVSGGYHFTSGVGFMCDISFDMHVMGYKLSP